MRIFKGTAHILAIDPGKATGVAFFSWTGGHDPVLIKSWEVQEDTFPALVRWAFENYDDVVVVCERFTITAQTAKNSQAPFSLEHIGMLKLMMRDAGMNPADIQFDSPTNAKNAFPNPMLKKINYWHKGGEGHALDAIRHGLLYAMKNGWNALKMLD